MVTNGENKDKSHDEISELLKKYYKLNKEINDDEFVQSIEKKINSLFHVELFSEKLVDNESHHLSNEVRYWRGLEEYINNEVSSLRHKVITDHLLSCKECRQNYNEQLIKKKEFSSINSQELVFV